MSITFQSTQGETCIRTLSCSAVSTAATTTVAFTFVDSLFDDWSYRSVLKIHTV